MHAHNSCRTSSGTGSHWEAFPEQPFADDVFCLDATSEGRVTAVGHGGTLAVYDVALKARTARTSVEVVAVTLHKRTEPFLPAGVQPKSVCWASDSEEGIVADTAGGLWLVRLSTPTAQFSRLL
jgi:hypothetical protein